MTPEDKSLYSPINKKDSDSMTMGSIEISSDVIASIAAQAARKVDGVVVVSSSFKWTEIFGGKDTPRRGVAVKTDEESGHVDINVDVDVRYGINIYESAHNLQILIKEEVEALTGSMIVDKVNIRVRNLVPVEENSSGVLPPDQAVDEQL